MDNVKQILVQALQEIPGELFDGLGFKVPLLGQVPITTITGGKNPIEYLLSLVGDKEIPHVAAVAIVDVARKIVNAVDETTN